ncbi:hypothetical protein BC936DRAFT_147165 [Jimgerdemannia flammicorona]|uniref:Uncharacterized protein n=1 Tax=Jimgerdemannia flammicorona TaxID=994334 RepID=A0A433DNC7_9FUNG|nr:hypothetical protein BC936DRAFT_147165 [Jimgerdemannia flammicorona]
MGLALFIRTHYDNSTQPKYKKARNATTTILRSPIDSLLPFRNAPVCSTIIGATVITAENRPTHSLGRPSSNIHIGLHTSGCTGATNVTAELSGSVAQLSKNTRRLFTMESWKVD